MWPSAISGNAGLVCSLSMKCVEVSLFNQEFDGQTVCLLLRAASASPSSPSSSPSSDSIPSSLSADEREPFFISSSEVCCQKLEVKGLLGPHWFDAFLQRSAVKGQKLKVCCHGSAALGIYSQGKQ